VSVLTICFSACIPTHCFIAAPLSVRTILLIPYSYAYHFFVSLIHVATISLLPCIYAQYFIFIERERRKHVL
jgi:hypothetical protein